MPLYELQVTVKCGDRRLEFVPCRGHQPLQAQPHRPLGQVPNGDDTAPGPVSRGERLGHRFEPAPCRAGPRKREFHAEPLSSGGALEWPAGRRDGKTCGILGHDRVPDIAEHPVVGGVGGQDETLVIDGHNGVAHAGEDGSQSIPLFLAADLLLLERLRLDAELVGSQREVFVGNTQLLHARGQFLVEGLQLLVGRLELLVDRFHFLAGGLRVLAGEEHRFVGHPEFRDKRGQLFIGPKKTPVGGDGLVQTLARSGVGSTLLFELGHLGQLDDRTFDGTRFDPLGPDLGFHEARRLAGSVRGLHLEYRRGGVADEG